MSERIGKGYRPRDDFGGPFNPPKDGSGVPKLPMSQSNKKETNMTHCDELIHEYKLPICLRYYLLVNRLPAVDKCIIIEANGEPTCYADYKGKRVRLVMASRFGDVGITAKLDQAHGYTQRVNINGLSNFSSEP